MIGFGSNNPILCNFIRIMLLSAKNICLTLGSHQILDKVSLNIYPQDFITIIGPNGAGKSMLLKCLMGLYKPTDGKIDKKPDLKIGYVPQRLHTDPTFPMTVKAFIHLRASKIASDQFEKIIAETKIQELLDKQLHILSGGQMQRVLLARSLMHNPELLILDEPAQNLDISGQLSLYKLLDKIYENRKLSIIMVSHDLHIVMASSRKVICLYKHICCDGVPNLITKDPEFIKLFGQDMADMMAIYQHSHTHHDGCQHDTI